MVRLLELSVCLLAPGVFGGAVPWSFGMGPTRRSEYLQRTTGGGSTFSGEGSLAGFSFYCLKSNEALPLEFVNDGYCDCEDGSDEPGTPACSTGHFWCGNEHHQPSLVPSGRVADGVCDCCDGTDEGPSSSCANTCLDAGRAFREAQAAREALRKSGLKVREALQVNGRALLEQWRREVAKLDEQEPAMRRELEYVTSGIEKLKASLPPPSPPSLLLASDAEDEKAAVSDEPVQAEGDEPVQAEGDEPVQAEGDEPVQAEGDEALEAEGDEGLSEYAKWMDHEAMGDAAEPLLVDSEEGDKESPQVDGPEGVVGSVVNKASALAGRVWHSFLRPASPLERLTKRQAALQKVLGDYANQRRSLSDNLDVKYGTAHQWVPLRDKCFSIKIEKYNYEICLFQSASQKENHSTTRLGSFKGLTEGQNAMEFNNGDRCWGGPQRSMLVKFECGTTTEVLEVSEPERCSYSARMTSPAACE